MLLHSVLALCLAAAVAAPAAPPVEILTRRSDVIWGFDFLPDGRIIFTERKGSLAIYDPKTQETVKIPGAPAVWAHGQGGLLDVRVHPDFARTRWIYLTWSQPVEGGAATAMGRGRLEKGKLAGFERLFVSNGGGSKGEHFGSRLEFDGPSLYLSHGDRGRRKLAQDLTRHNGKILRFTHDGKPDGAKIEGALPEIWSYGHRNPQGLAVRPGTRELWSAEMGPRGGDELNLVERGSNYGWPEITYGREYYGPKIGPPAKEGMAQPAAYWVPSISPSALAFHGRDAAVLACLSGSQLRRVSLKGKTPAGQAALLKGKGWRFRAARQGPDGLLYFSTDEGLLGRVFPES